MVSDEVEAIFLKALAVRPEDRYQTAGEFWSALRAHVLGGSDRLISMQTPRASDRGPIATSDTVVADSAPNPSAPTLAQTPPRAPAPVPALAPAPAPAPAPAKSRTPLFIGLAVVALGLAGGGYALRSGSQASITPSGSASAPVATTTTSVAPPASASAAPTPAGSCPPGMLKIPGGEYFMGSDEKDADPSEKPPHKVKLSAYCIDELEVTVAQYKECSDKGACRRAGKENIWPGIVPAQRKIYDPLCNITDPIEKAKHPINCVDWEQAREACDSRGGRLPTEAEWEFAARGSDGRVYPWGDAPPSADLLNACGKECVAWQKKHPDPQTAPALMYDQDDGFPNTAPVGSFPKGKSRWGLQDVVGNVWEWVSDYYAEYDKDAAKAPAQDPKGPATGPDRVIRGGAWNGSMPSWVRPSFRFHVAPDARSYGFGFRCAKSL